MSKWHSTAHGKQKMAEWRKSLEGKRITAEAKAKYRQSAEGKAKERAYKAAYRERENELARERAKQPENLVKLAIKAKRRRAALIPRMHLSHRAEIEAIYARAAEQRLTVDHIIPLYGETVWGLHAPQNLQLLTREDNSRKANRLPGSVQR
jgi:5-methylcytosine-specific restriction endonuclease McrA